MLVSAAAEQWGVSPSECQAREGEELVSITLENTATGELLFEVDYTSNPPWPGTPRRLPGLGSSDHPYRSTLQYYRRPPNRE